MLLTVSHDFLPKQNSARAAIVMDHFGIGFENGRHVIADDFDLPIDSGDVVLFTGASGSGKSSLMRAAVEGLKASITTENTHGARPVGLGDSLADTEPSTINC